jgi:hypothetical protein
VASVTAPPPTDEEQHARRFARLIAEELVEVLGRERGIFVAADVSPRPREEEERWRDEKKGSGSSGPIPSESSGELSWSEREAREIIGSIRRKKKLSKSSAL